MPKIKQDSNLTGLAIAEEVSLKTLPGTPVWYAQEPNEYSDFGSDVTTVARAPINAGRQNQKGGVVDFDASGGFNMDFTQANAQRLLQGFFFADAREKQKSDPISVAARNPVVGIATNVLTFTNNFTTAIPTGALFELTGFVSPANNGFKVGTVGGLKTVTLAGMVDDASPGVASAEMVGVQFPSATASLTFTGGVASLVVSSGVLNTYGLTPGEWVFLGGDAVANRFNNNVGYARIKTINAGSLVFDKVSWSTFTAEAGTGKTIQMFFGTVIRNEKLPALIKRRSYSIERQLGADDVAMQAEYLDGAIPNELTINIPQADKLNADLTFVAMDNKQVTGTEGIRSGTRVNALGESLVNTSTNVYRMKMSIIDPANPAPTGLFAYITEADIGINNGVSPEKAIGVTGAFEAALGNFEVTGSVNAFFSDVNAVKAVRNNADVTVDFIFGLNNGGFVIDIPLLGLGGGRLDVTSGESIKLPLDIAAGENAAGYTMMMCFFNYLPAIAMGV
jgi:hypothetical protein